MRDLTPDDLDWVVDLTRTRRETLVAHAPLFWRPAADADERHRAFLALLVSDSDTLAVRTEHGYLLAVDRGDHTLVDDMVVSPDEYWPTEGEALLREAMAYADRLRFVVPAFESERFAAARAVGLAPVECWWHRDLETWEPAGPGGSDEVVVDGALGRLVTAPPVYDPGGPVLIVTEVWTAAALTRIEAAAAARGAPVAVVTQRPDDLALAGLLHGAGYTLTTYFCESR